MKEASKMGEKSKVGLVPQWKHLDFVYFCIHSCKILKSKPRALCWGKYSTLSVSLTLFSLEKYFFYRMDNVS